MLAAMALQLVLNNATIKTPVEEIKTEKAVIIDKLMTTYSTMGAILDMARLRNKPGPLVVIFDTPGGDVSTAKGIMTKFTEEKKAGNKVICLVHGIAASLGFNLLTHCDERYATRNSVLMFHRTWVQFAPGSGFNSVALKAKAEELEKLDLIFAEPNAKALNMTLKQYYEFADVEKRWTPEELIKIGYLKDIAELNTN